MVLRFHAHPRLRHTGDTVEEHQRRVTTLCLSLAAHIRYPVYDGDLLNAAATHDAAEEVIGDMPGPAKQRFPALAAEYAKAERQILGEMGKLYELTRQEEAMLRLCDRYDAWEWAVTHGETGGEWTDAKGDMVKLAMQIGPDALEWLTERLDRVTASV